jgi:spore coat polysaccharide biosynthesis protein SpsF (cytidylyltransferase family)
MVEERYGNSLIKQQSMSKKQLVLIIQARMNSTRFPNKVISDLEGSPLIESILQRVKKKFLKILKIS